MTWFIFKSYILNKIIKHKSHCLGRIFLGNFQVYPGWALVLEVSQAFGLDNIFENCGKYITSTHTIVAGALADAGLTPGDIPGGTIIITKAYASKVGGGYFITEFGNGDDNTPEETVFWPDFQEDYEPIYVEIPVDWDIKHCTDETKLPDGVWKYLGCTAFYTGADICYIGTGGSNRDIIELSEYGKQKIAKAVNEIKELYDIKSDINELTKSIEDHIRVSDYIVREVEGHEWPEEILENEDIEIINISNEINDIDKGRAMKDEKNYDISTFNGFENQTK